ncbi:hypothetical protein [Diaminobutyricimonas aerilata]|nr:hypothetical protein [Diaminobutyricimonas aerilata]
MLAAIIIGFVLSLLWSWAPPMIMLREELHVGCSLLSMGDEPGEYYCGDGIGYLLPVFSLLGVSLVACFIAAAITLMAASDRARPTLNLIALAPAFFIAGGTWVAAHNTWPKDNVVEHWLETMGAAATWLLATVVFAIVAAFVSPRAAALCSFAAAASAIAAAATQPGITVAAATSAGILIAAAVGRPPTAVPTR